jgi:hypothetical protein
MSVTILLIAARGRLAALLGLDRAETDLLVTSCAARIGDRACSLRLAVLLLATAPVVRALLPLRIRRRAIRPFVYPLLSGASENLLYAKVESAPATADD